MNLTLTIFRAVIVIYVVTMYCMLYNGSWFCYHPLFMITSFFGLMPDVIFKISKWRKKVYYAHMYTNIIAFGVAMAGLYVIYTNKISLNKDHFTTLHGKVGIVILIGIGVQSVLSYLKMHPSRSVMDRKPFRNYHIWFGKIVFMASLIESLYGIYIIGNNNVLIIASSLAFLYVLTLVINIRQINRFVGTILYDLKPNNDELQ